MKQALIMSAISLLMRYLTPDLIKKGWDYVIEKIEAFVEATETSIDDFLWKAAKGSTDELRVLGDAIIDFGEDFVLGTASQIDDALVLPVFNTIRDALDIPDND